MLYFKSSIKTCDYVPTLDLLYALVRTEMLFKGYYKENSGLLDENSNYFNASNNCN